MRGAGWVYHVLRLAIAGVFIYAGAIKAMDPLKFATQIRAYELTGFAVGGVLAVWLPWLELFCGLALLVNRLVRGALFWVMVLMVVFTAAQVSAWIRGLNLDCGCFGEMGKPIHPAWVIGRDGLILLAVAVLAFLSMRKPPTQDRTGAVS